MPEILLTREQYSKARDLVLRAQDEGTDRIMFGFRPGIPGSSEVIGELVMVGGDPLALFSPGRVWGLDKAIASRMIYAQSHAKR